MRRTRMLCSVIVASSIMPGMLGAQTVPSSAHGITVTPDAAPVVGVSVTLRSANGDSRAIITGDDGTFRFAGVPRAGSVLLVRRIGFLPDSIVLGADPVRDEPLTVVLTPAPEALATVVVRAPRAVGPLADFYRRRATGMGRYIARADIEKRHPSYTTDLLRMTPGLSLVRGAGSTALRFRGSTCAPEVFLDGTLLGPLELDFDTLAPGSIEGIELYSGAASVPAEFSRTRGHTACGTVVVWTREGERRPPRPKGAAISSAQLSLLIESSAIYTAAQVESAAQLLSDLAAEIHVPVALGEWSAPATVVAEFVVDAAGRVEPLTINVAAASGPGFADAVRFALPGARFTPALRAGRPVRQFAQLSVVLDPAATRR